MAEAGNTYQLEPNQDEMYSMIDLVSSLAVSRLYSRVLSLKNLKMSLMTLLQVHS